MPLPIVCLNQSLRQHLQRYRAHFSLAQWPYFVTVLLGLVQSEERRTLTGWLRVVVSGVTLSGLSRFLTHAPWDLTAVVAQWWHTARPVLQQVVNAACQHQIAARPPRRGRPKRPFVMGYLIFDDSVQQKPRGQHYATTARRVVPGHSLVQGLYVVEGRRCPLAPQLYRQQKTCEREGVPFASKIALVQHQLEAFTPLERTKTYVLVDSWYLAKTIWKAARQRGYAMAGGARKNRQLRLVHPDGTRTWQRFDAYAATLAPEAFTTVAWPSQHGGTTLAVHLVRTRVHGLGACQVVVVRSTPDAPPTQSRFFVTSQVEDTLTQVVTALAMRWTIEVFFEDLKDVLGSDHYQVLHDQAILRIWTLACCLYTALEDAQAAYTAATGEHWSIGQVRRAWQEDHRLNLLEWLHGQFAQGATPIALFQRLAA